jgi:sarcosine oxidase subunit alpha
MLAGAARAYVQRYAVRCGHARVIFTNNDEAYATAAALEHAGVHVAAIVDARPTAR